MTKTRQDVLDYVKKNVNGKGNQELADEVNKLFGTNYNRNSMGCFKKYHKLKGNNHGQHKAINRVPVGTEWERKDGYIWIKVEEPNVWKPKGRYIYEQYHNVTVPKNYKVIFLNQDRQDFSIENLYMVHEKDSLMARNLNVLSKNKETTKTGLMVAELYNKTKNMKEGKDNEN